MHVEYSNNPNQVGEGDTGKTPDDVNIVFTYEVVFNKVHVENGEKKPLPSADFNLYKFVKSDNGTDTIDGKADGVKGTWTSVTELGSSNTEKPSKSTTDTNKAPATAGKNGTATTFTFKGLDEGTYKLVETATPAGYNSIDDQIFTITATHDIVSDNPTLTALTSNDNSALTFTPNINDGSLSTDVVNRAGNTLPSTGGIGTTIFYVAGACLAVVAGVILVARKRMSSER